MEEEVSIKARGFQCCRDERWRVCGDGLQTTTFYWQFFIDLVLQAESWCLVLQIKQKRQRFRLWAFGQTSRAASLHTLCQLFFNDVWFVTNGLLCVCGHVNDLTEVILSVSDINTPPTGLNVEFVFSYFSQDSSLFTLYSFYGAFPGWRCSVLCSCVTNLRQVAGISRSGLNLHTEEV